MTVSSGANDEIVTTIWIDPKSGADHSITVMRCGDQWWSYVDTARIREDCASKESAIAAAEAHLIERYENYPGGVRPYTANTVVSAHKIEKSGSSNIVKVAACLIAFAAISALTVA